MFWIYQPAPDFVGMRDSFLSWIPCAVARSDPAPTIEFAPPILPSSTSFRFVRRIQESEVKDALKRMKGGKAMGPDGLPIEVWRSLGDVAIVWLTMLFNLIFRSNKMSEECKRSILVRSSRTRGMCKVVLIITGSN
jgi:hypothetical protein